MRALAFLPFVAAACSPPAKTPAAAAESRYRKGDFVHYRYSGTFAAKPVELVERVVEQNGLRLHIDVEASRGDERRHWVQVVTDTPFNQKNNVVDELYIVENGARRRLKNVNNNDVYWLFDWTYVIPEGIPTDLSEADVDRTLGGASYRCHARRGVTRLKGRPVRFEEVDCPAFLWTRADATFVDVETGETAYRAEIVEVGRR